MDLSTHSRLAAREPTVRRAVILSAGKATRLGGANKLTVEAGGLPVSEWHRRLLEGFRVAVVAPTGDAAGLAMALPWADRVLGHARADGPVGALSAYLSAYPEDGEIVVLFADTLLAPQSLPEGDWVGVADSPQRRWDFPAGDGIYLRGTLAFPVCVGIYSFSWASKLREAAAEAMEDGTIFGERDVPMIRLLNRYEPQLREMPVRGWHDAGDPEAISRVPSYEAALLEAPKRPEVGGIVSVRWTR